MKGRMERRKEGRTEGKKERKRKYSIRNISCINAKKFKDGYTIA
jgi:hypothetical protein